MWRRHFPVFALRPLPILHQRSSHDNWYLRHLRCPYSRGAAGLSRMWRACRQEKVSQDCAAKKTRPRQKKTPFLNHFFYYCYDISKTFPIYTFPCPHLCHYNLAYRSYFPFETFSPIYQHRDRTHDRKRASLLGNRKKTTLTRLFFSFCAFLMCCFRRISRCSSQTRI